MKITKKLTQFVSSYNNSDHMLVVETSAPAGWGRPNTLDYCLERPGANTSHGRVIGTVAEVKAAIASREVR